jgi:hypothetical protein
MGGIFLPTERNGMSRAVSAISAGQPCRQDEMPDCAGFPCADLAKAGISESTLEQIQMGQLTAS